MYEQKDQTARLVPGLVAAISLAIVATFLGRLEPVIGGPVFGIALGMLVATDSAMGKGQSR